MQVSPIERVKGIISIQGRWILLVVLIAMFLHQVHSLNGPNVCMVKQKYNITKRIKYRAPMSVRTYEWCFAMPPRCSHWTTEMRDLTRLETEERTAEVAVCCPGYKMKDITCIPICPNGRTGPGCSEDCPKNKWGPNCVNECKDCTNNGTCSPSTGECICQDGWKGESCQIRMSTTTTNILTDPFLTTATPATSTPAIIAVTSESTKVVTTTQKPLPEIGAISTVKPKKTSLSNISTETFTNNRNNSKSHFWASTKENPKEVTENISVTINTFNVNKSFTTLATAPTVEVIDKMGIPTQTTERKPVITTSRPTSKTRLIYTSTTESTMGIEFSRNIETTPKVAQAVTKIKPKEIWIKPAQKGELPIIETKFKTSNETMQSRNKYVTKKFLTSVNTTPRTIIVSIIPTSIAYSTFKKISLTTATYQQTKNEFDTSHRYKNNHYTIPASWTTKANSNSQASTSLQNFTLKLHPSGINDLGKHTISSSASPTMLRNISKSHHLFKTTSDLPSTMEPTTLSHHKEYLTTNSMTTTSNNEPNSISYSSFTAKYSYSPPTNYINFRNDEKLLPSTEHSHLSTNEKMENITSIATKSKDRKTSTRPSIKHFMTLKGNILPTTKNKYESDEQSTKITRSLKELASTTVKENISSTNKNGILTKLTTINISKNSTNTITSTEKVVANEDETFDILTEPEHITAVMGEKEKDRSSLDLLSVLSIAGGSMMAIITVAVVVVMIERCKRSRYDDMHKVNNIRMQVVVENTDVPPPYVRSIFHTPLPDPPTNEKCHYQPISTLDRNLKQFMRPVVVQAISPVMLENFRGILECHYDHLPRRSSEFIEMQRHSIAPSLVSIPEPHQTRIANIDYTVSESTIEALKCEAKLNVIDSSSEPLYAEIPSWRPPSEHAIEIVSLKGEALTEL